MSEKCPKIPSNFFYEAQCHQIACFVQFKIKIYYDIKCSVLILEAVVDKTISPQGPKLFWSFWSSQKNQPDGVAQLSWQMFKMSLF